MKQATDELPVKGGSYQRNPDTGALKLVEKPTEEFNPNAPTGAPAEPPGQAPAEATTETQGEAAQKKGK